MEEKLSSKNTAEIVADTTFRMIDEIDELLEDFIDPEIMRLPQALEAMTRARTHIAKARESLSAAHDAIDAFELFAFGQKASIMCPCAPQDLIDAFNDTIAAACTLPDGDPSKTGSLPDLGLAQTGIIQAQEDHDKQDIAGERLNLRVAMHGINDARQGMKMETLTSVICEDLPEITATSPEERLKQIQARIMGVQRRISQCHGGEYLTYWAKEWTALRKEREVAVMEARIMCHDYSLIPRKHVT